MTDSIPNIYWDPGDGGWRRADTDAFADTWLVLAHGQEMHVGPQPLEPDFDDIDIPTYTVEIRFDYHGEIEDAWELADSIAAGYSSIPDGNGRVIRIFDPDDE